MPIGVILSIAVLIGLLILLGCDPGTAIATAVAVAALELDLLRQIEERKAAKKNETDAEANPVTAEASRQESE